MSPKFGKVFRVSIVFWKDKNGRGQATVLRDDCAAGAQGVTSLKFLGPDYLRVVKGL